MKNEKQAGKRETRNDKRETMVKIRESGFFHFNLKTEGDKPLPYIHAVNTQNIITAFGKHSKSFLLYQTHKPPSAKSALKHLDAENVFTSVP